MFPGQGAQALGMAGGLCGEVPAARARFDEASSILGYDLLAKCVHGPLEELNSTAVAQPAIFVASMAALERLRLQDPEALARCTVAMGLSLGEYSALCFAGAFSFEDGVRLTKARGEAMQAAADLRRSGMVGLLGVDERGAEAICRAAAARSGQPIGIGNYLMEGNYVVSGAMEACDAVRELAPSMGARSAVPLAVAGAFHTSLMQPAVAPLAAFLEEVDIQPTRIPVISNVDGAAHGDAASIRRRLAQQVVAPVQWEAAMKAMLAAPDFEKCYEIGPGNVCKGIIMRFRKRTPIVSIAA